MSKFKTEIHRCYYHTLPLPYPYRWLAHSHVGSTGSTSAQGSEPYPACLSKHAFSPLRACIERCVLLYRDLPVSPLEGGGVYQTQEGYAGFVRLGGAVFADAVIAPHFCSCFLVPFCVVFSHWQCGDLTCHVQGQWRRRVSEGEAWSYGVAGWA